MCGGVSEGLAPVQMESIGEERSETAGALTQIQQVWILMSQLRKKCRAQWVIDHTWISLLPVNSFWVMDKPGLWSGPTALYSLGERVCVFVYVGGLRVNGCGCSCVSVLTVQQCVCLWANKHVGVCEHVFRCMKGTGRNMPKVIFLPCSLDNCCLFVTIVTLWNTICVEGAGGCEVWVATIILLKVYVLWCIWACSFY